MNTNARKQIGVYMSAEVSDKTKQKQHRTKLEDRSLPDYTRGEEVFNMVSHIVGGAFGIATLILCTVTAFFHNNLWGIISGTVYGVSMIMLYCMSSIYHGLKPVMAKKVFQVIDHCTIYFLISGTYTPILLTGLREYNSTLAWSLFGIVWGISAIAVVFTAIDLRKYRVFSMVCYMLIGWCVIFAIVPILKCYSWRFFAWILSGGVGYTFGAVLYGIASKGNHRYVHSIFHLFVILGSVLQFVGIYMYCM